MTDSIDLDKTENGHKRDTKHKFGNIPLRRTYITFTLMPCFFYYVLDVVVLANSVVAGRI